MGAGDNTPILVGAGEFAESPGAIEYRGLSPVELAAEAARAAFRDALSLEALASHVDLVGAVRPLDISRPGAVAPFGRSNNFPSSVARRLGVRPARAVVSMSGGQAPQRLVNDIAISIAAGQVRVALLVGAEATSTINHLTGQGARSDWSETVEGALEDRGSGLAGLGTLEQERHRVFSAPAGYGLCENARRARLKLSREQYAKQMGELFATFTRVAAMNPYAAWPKRCMAGELVTVTAGNRMIAEPYPQLLANRDQVNQGAALIMTSAGAARALGIDESKWVYLHGYADVQERKLLERPDLGSSPAAIAACRAALDSAGIGVEQLGYLDLYSCCPIAVFNVLDGLNLNADDPRGFTVTGGGAYFGTPGNNYSMHAIAACMRRLRAQPGSYALVGANGGVLSKYSVGIYSTQPTAWRRCNNEEIQVRLDCAPAGSVDQYPDGAAHIETYTVVYEKGAPAYAVIVGRLEANNRRFLALSADGDADLLARMLREEPIGQRIFARSTGYGNCFTFSRARMNTIHPLREPALRSSYRHLQVDRHDRLLEITINRPEVHNCLHPPASEELSEVFDAYFADPGLCVAIIVGAGTRAFCAGYDLKYQASGKPLYTPRNGFGGLTSRKVRDKPVIAAVNGYAFGGGFELCLACDLVIADDKAQFALTEVRVGLLATEGGIVRLCRQIPKKQAVEMILTGRRVGAEEARQLGLVNCVTPSGLALDGARKLASEILDGAPISVQCALEAIDVADQPMSVMEAMAQQTDLLFKVMTSDDMIEGAQAFSQKRKPKWRGR